jgi:hypothetical protein
MIPIRPISFTLFLTLFLGGFPMLALAQQSTAQVLAGSGRTPPLARNAFLDAQATRFTPPNPGLPGRRQPASPRGPCFPGKKPLTALLPATNLGLTVAAYPTFFFYVPETSATTVEFVLLDEENGNKVYETTFTTSGKPRIFSLSLPASKTLPPLKIGKNYHWYFSVICDPEDRAGDVYVDGWVQRVEPSPALMRELDKASPGKQVALYQKYDLWHETLTTLARQRRLSPNDSVLVAKWANLLRAVGLEEIAQEQLS